MESLFCCPLCSAPLERDGRRWFCANRHSFDRAAAGYVHLLPANRKHSKDPGDDKDMVAARSAFLDQGYYAPLRDTLCGAVLDYLDGCPNPVLADSGCGEGYYTAGLFHALTGAGAAPEIAGVDLSRFAMRRAAKRVPEAEFAVASAYRLPIANGRINVLTNIFSPLAIDEFARVLQPGGLFCYAVPSARHLWQMKEILYSKPYENPVKRESYPGFQWIGAREVRDTLDLKDSAAIMALFHMTPYAWKTPKEGISRLEQLDRLTCEMGFDLHLYRKV